jgi:hypothetical protein
MKTAYQEVHSMEPMDSAAFDVDGIPRLVQEAPLKHEDHLD